MANTFWEEFKNLFKTDVQLEEERQKKINEALGAEKEITDKLQKLEKEYEASLPDEEIPDIDKLFPNSFELKEIEYKPRSDEDIVASAKKEADYEKNSDKIKIEDKFQSAVDALSEDKTAQEETLKSSYDNLEKLYAELREQANNDSIKRGMARSSVATQRLDALDALHMASATEAEKTYANAIAKINGEISALERDRDNALEQLDLKWATELDERIENMKAQRDKTVKEYEEYNNDVRREKEEYEKSRQKSIDKYLDEYEKEKAEKEEEQREYEHKYGYSGDKLKNYSERYNLAYDFYSSLSPDIAVDALKASPNMKYYLGELYDKLLSSLKSKESDTKHYF